MTESLPECIGCDATIGEIRENTFLMPGGVIAIKNPYETLYICPECARDETRRAWAHTRYDHNRRSFFEASK